MNNDLDVQQLPESSATEAAPEITPTAASEPEVVATTEPALVEMPVGVSITAIAMKIKAYGFDAAQLRPLAEVWTIPGVMQRQGLITVDTSPALVHLTRNFLVSLIAGGAKIGRFAAAPKLKQSISLLSKPGPAELALMFSHLAAGPDCPQIELHQLCGGANSEVSLAERAAGDLIEARLKPKGVPNAAPHVVHILVRARQFAEIDQRKAVVARLKRLLVAGMSVIVIWERRTETEWAPPDDLGDASFTVRNAFHPTADRALAMRMVWSNFVSKRDLPPQVLSVKAHKTQVSWSSENYVSDDPDLMRMYQMKAAGATLRQIAAVAGVDHSTVSRRLKELDKELAAR